MQRPFAVLLVSAAIAGAPAFAATDTFKLEIDYNTARLDSPQTVPAEYASIRDQVRDRCEAEHAEVKIGYDFVVRTCTRRTLNIAVRKIDHPSLTAVHAASR